MTNLLFWIYNNALWIGATLIIGLIAFWLYSSITEVIDGFNRLSPNK